MWQYRKVYARWCVPSPRAPTTAPDAPPLHLYSTSDPADSVPTSPMTPPNPHFRIQSSFYLPPPNPPLPYLCRRPTCRRRTYRRQARHHRLYLPHHRRLRSLCRRRVFRHQLRLPPRPHLPSDADTDHSVPMTPSSSPIVYLHLSTRSYRRHTPALISRGSVRAPPGSLRRAWCSLNRFISLGRSSRFLCCALAHKRVRISY